jgi:hypothetical protein
MSVTRIALLAGLAVAVPAVGVAQAQSQEPPPPGSERFFADKIEDDEEDEADETLWQGSLVGTALGHRETAAVSAPLLPGGQGAENASPVNRVYGDMRARLEGRRLKGKNYNFHLDARARLTGDGDFQSGVFGDNEYEVRELYLSRPGDKTDYHLGRQFVLELAAIKIDGLRVVHRKDAEWSYLGFAGAYPSRQSRSVTTDYPTVENIDGTTTRILPVTAGLGAAYRFDRMYGSFGAVAILPRGTDRETGTLEKPRVFVTSSGYYRRSPKLDFYHFVVLDAEGAAGRGLTNLSLGANARPRPNVRLSASVNRVDTETLNVVAQTQLEDPDPLAPTLVQNNIEVMRIASESARVGLSVSFRDDRFDVFTVAQVRRRPEITIESFDDMMVLATIPKAQAADITLGVIDRRSIKDLRLRASYTSIFGIGDTNANRSESDIVRIGGSRELKDGLAEADVELTYLASEDDNRDAMCIDLLTCFGTSRSRSISATGLLFYRFKKDWFMVGSASLGTQTITTSSTDGTETKQPSILLTTAFARLAYRF